MITKITQAILKINPSAEVTVKGDDINTCEIEWYNGTTPISKADIEAKMAELPTEQKLKDLGLNDAEIKALIGV